MRLKFVAQPPHLSRDIPKMRNCLRCGVDFDSAGAHNRICECCKSKKSARQVVSKREEHPVKVFNR